MRSVWAPSGQGNNGFTFALGELCRWKAVELFLIIFPSLALISSNTPLAPCYGEEISDLRMLRRYIIVHLLVAGPSFLFGETKLNSSRKILGDSSSHRLLNLACSQLPFLPTYSSFSLEPTMTGKLKVSLGHKWASSS